MDINSKVLVGLLVDGYFESFGHGVFEGFNVFEACGGDERVVDMNPYVDAVGRVGELVEKAGVGDRTRETIVDEVG